MKLKHGIGEMTIIQKYSFSVAVGVFGSMTQTLLSPPTAVPTSTLGGRHDTQQLISITSPR